MHGMGYAVWSRGMAEGKDGHTDDPYSILQVGRTADIFEIRKSYQQLARTYHPDKHPEQLSAAERAAAVIHFQKVTKAYEVLSDAKLRQEFDVNFTADQLTQTWPLSATVDLDDMTFDPSGGTYSTPCRCGGGYTITEGELERSMDTVPCSTCTLSIRVLYRAMEEGENSDDEQGA